MGDMALDVPVKLTFRPSRTDPIRCEGAVMQMIGGGAILLGALVYVIIRGPGAVIKAFAGLSTVVAIVVLLCWSGEHWKAQGIESRALEGFQIGGEVYESDKEWEQLSRQDLGDLITRAKAKGLVIAPEVLDRYSRLK
jgi:hypothetical protein